MGFSLWATPTKQQPAPAGWFGDPSDRSGATQRWWDGEAWSPKTRQAATAQPLPKWKRHPFAFFRHRWLHVLVVLFVLSLIVAVIAQVTKSQALYVVALVVGAVPGAAGFAVFLAGRLRLTQVLTWPSMIVLAILCGAVGNALAFGIELGLTKLWGMTATVVLVGPIEESCILLVPVLIYFYGPRRMRDPRAGLILVLASAAGFGIFENIKYAVWIAFDLNHKMGAVPGSVARMSELHRDLAGFGVALLRSFEAAPLHMCITGIVAAVAWRAWHLRGGFRLTPAVIGALLTAYVLHSSFDSSSMLFGGKAGGLLSLALFVAAYLIFKAFAREDTPPDALEHVPPGWRPWRLRSIPEEPSSAVAGQLAAEAMPTRPVRAA